MHNKKDKESWAQIRSKLGPNPINVEPKPYSLTKKTQEKEKCIIGRYRDGPKTDISDVSTNI